MKITRLLFFIPALIVFTSCTSSPVEKPFGLPSIEKSSGNHIVHFSNKTGSFWSTESRNYNSHWSTGYVSHRERIFGDIYIRTDGNLLPRDESKINYSPVSFERHYESGLVERWFMPDSYDALIVELVGHNAESVEITIDDVPLPASTTSESLVIGASSVVAPLSRSLNTGLGIHLIGGTVTDADVENTSQLRISIRPEADNLKLIIQLGDGPVISEMGDIDGLMHQKRSRLDSLLALTRFSTDDSRLNDAWVWALSSFDALNMNEEETGLGKGIYAGYPWFQDYWGRDSFIALRALTVTGQFKLAAENLESFLKFQNLDSSSTDFGKIPNRVRPDEIIYNTADATPRFIIEADRYVAYSGDTAFARRIFPNVDAAIRGTLRYRADGNAMLIHGAADTWMDAVGPQGPYSPRADRAVDIQALWIDALAGASNLARFKRGLQADELVRLANVTRDQAIESFQLFFRNPSAADPESTNPLLYDAVGKDGTPSTQLRPNMLFATHLVPGTKTKHDITLQATKRMGTPWGISSLDPSDPKFLAYHKAEPLYEQDASYHNGIVWLWNSGIWIEMLLRHGMIDQAWDVTRNYVDIMLDNITLGTLPELIDSKPRKGIFADTYPDADNFARISRLDQMSLKNEAEVAPHIPALSGTWSQAWSLSEFIRNIAEDYVGLRYEAGSGFVLKPQVPASWGSVMSVRKFAGYDLELRRVSKDDTSTWLIRVDGSGDATPIPLVFMVPGMSHPVVLELDGSEQRFEVRESRGRLAIIMNNQVIEPEPAPPSAWMDGLR
jgi:glycogen debranching enzyme